MIGDQGRGVSSQRTRFLRQVRCASEAESGRGREADDALLEQHVEGAVGAGDDVTDAAEILEDDLLGDNFAVDDLDAQELFRRERRKEDRRCRN